MFQRPIFCAILAAVLALFSPAIAIANPVDLFFSAAPYKCGKGTYILEWQLVGETDGEIVLNRFVRRIDRAGKRFEGMSWTLAGSDFAEPIDLSKKGGRAQWRISGLIDGEPSVVSLTRKGEIRTDCAPVLTPAQPALVRFQDFIDLLDTPLPTPELASRVRPALNGLPPTNLLAKSKRVEIQGALKEKQSAFWARYRENMLVRASDPSDAALLPALHEIVGMTDKIGAGEWHTQTLSLAMTKRVDAIAAEGIDVFTNAVADDDFCPQMGALPRISDRDTYLLVTTGVPISLWNKSFMQRSLDLAATCDGKGEYFAGLVKRRWPKIEKLQAGLIALDQEVARIASLELSLESLQAEDWLKFNVAVVKRLNDMGVDAGTAGKTLKRALKARGQDAIPVLGAELAQGIAAVELALLPKHCGEKARAAFGRSRLNDLLKAAEAVCNDEAAVAFEQAGQERIATRLDELRAMDESIQALSDSNFFSLGGVVSLTQRLPSQFGGAKDRLTQALVDADALLDPKRMAATEAAKAEIGRIFEDAGPLDPEGTAKDYCAPILTNTNKRIEQLRNRCETELSILRNRQSKARCDAIWESVDGPKGFREGVIATPFEQRPLPVEVVVCSPKFQNSNLKIEDNSGLFKTEFLLTRDETIGGTAVRFTAVLSESESSAKEWALSEAAINDQPLEGSNFKTSVDFMRCGFFIGDCFRKN